MADLRDLFETLGYGDVQTYIQSGNVLFSATGARSTLEDTIERALEARLGYPVVVVVRTHRQLHNVVTKAPRGFGADPSRYFSDAIFLKNPLTAAAALSVVERREGVDEAWKGTGVLYFQRLGAERTKSRLNRIVGRPEYQLMTIRSWTTTTKLLALLDA